ncbi:Transmembrane protein 97 [Dipsacomyces acuminosporus]|nr:Transmembrane protein 97 [Dipsacomyces acuminosporus]
MASSDSQTLAGRRLDFVYFVYFAAHIPITIFVDIVPLLPVGCIPAPLLALNSFLTGQLRDPFMIVGSQRTDLTWFRSFLFCELLFQLPFLFYAAWTLWYNSPHRHLPLVVYGAHVSTTMAPILGTLVFATPDRSLSDKALLASMYLPYLLIPLSMTAVSFIKCSRLISSKSKAE